MHPQLTAKILHWEGCPLHYWISERTQGPWIVFIHGAGSDHRMFRHQLSAIPPEFSLLLLDLRGHGKSRPMGKTFSAQQAISDILALMEHVGCSQATFVGQSLGGNIVQELVFYHPNKVEGLVLIGCACNTLPLAWLEKAALKLTPTFLRLVPWNFLKHCSALIGSRLPEEQKYLLHCFDILGKADFIRVFSSTAQCMHHEPNYRLDHRLLLVCGQQDISWTIKLALGPWAKRDSDCQVQQIPLARHCAHQDNPLVFNKLLTDFLYNSIKT